MILTSPVVTISHGTTVALFNRIKSQTTSTRYLSVVPDFTRTLGSDGRPVTGAKTPQYADEKGALKGFTADASFWESFIIWLVDPSLPSGPSNHQPPNPDWPRPPANIIPLNTISHSIRYNSTVVLQSLRTGVISPTLVVRRIETDSDAVGMDGHVHEVPAMPPGELASDLVSQLQKVAFEIYSPDTMNRLQRESKYGGSWLSCYQDEVREHAIKADSDPRNANSWALLHSLGSHDMSAMRDIIGMPEKCLCATRSNDGDSSWWWTALFQYKGFKAYYEVSTTRNCWGRLYVNMLTREGRWPSTKSRFLMLKLKCTPTTLVSRSSTIR